MLPFLGKKARSTEKSVSSQALIVQVWHFQALPHIPPRFHNPPEKCLHQSHLRRRFSNHICPRHHRIITLFQRNSSAGFIGCNFVGAGSNDLIRVIPVDILAAAHFILNIFLAENAELERMRFFSITFPTLSGDNRWVYLFFICSYLSFFCAS